MEIGQTNKDGSAVDDVTAELVRRVVVGEWPVASRIPSERGLVTELAASRATVRSAIDRLQSWGMLIARQGSGTSVQERLNWRVGAVPAVLRVLVDIGEWDMLSVYLIDALGLRRALVLEMLLRAAPLAEGKPLLRALDATYAAWDARDDTAEFLRRDHLALANMLQEAGLQITLSLINEIRRTYEIGVLLLAESFVIPPSYIETHVGMFDALRAGDGVTARACFERYINDLDQELVGALPQPLAGHLLAKLGEMV